MIETAGLAGSPALRRRILVVDDDVQFCELVDAWLGRSYELDVAHDGEAGVTRARRERPDVILLDVMMPKLSGFSLAWVFKHDPFFQDVPVVYCTAHAQEMPNGPESLTRADAYLLKPFRLSELQATIQRLLVATPAPLEALDLGSELAGGATLAVGESTTPPLPCKLSLWGAALATDLDVAPGTDGRLALASAGPLAAIRCRVLGRTPAGLLGLRIVFDGQVDRPYLDFVGKLAAAAPQGAL